MPSLGDHGKATVDNGARQRRSDSERAEGSLGEKRMAGKGCLQATEMQWYVVLCGRDCKHRTVHGL